MRKLETIHEFYEVRHKWIPDEIRNSLGHFNAFSLEYPNIGEEAEPLEYGRRNGTTSFWFTVAAFFNARERSIRLKSCYCVHQSFYAFWLVGTK
ncbi:MAG: hypothetical protein IPI42_16245 [Saprospiraceae bacterium]|nr:hypothetical protein [Candidatus Parvibacillus calidus]